MIRIYEKHTYISYILIISPKDSSVGTPAAKGRPPVPEKDAPCPDRSPVQSKPGSSAKMVRFLEKIRGQGASISRAFGAKTRADFG